MIGPANPRSLLRQLREIMAEGATGQSRLDRIVEMIAATMVANVCSIYLLRQDGTAELFATEGLKPEAVHNTRLAKGEGLVGLVVNQAEAVNLSDAPSHPAFSYRPETGEDPFYAFLGVPILRGGRPVGVLVVQNRAQRRYAEEEAEALQTIAMVLAEVVATDGFLSAEGTDVAVKLRRQDRLVGKVFSEGVTSGTAVLAEPVFSPTRLLSDNAIEEEARLQAALASLQDWTERMMSDKGAALMDGSREMLEAYHLLAHDPSWRHRLSDAVRQGLTAEAAVARARSEHRARLGAVKDSYLRDRLHDMEDLANRLLRHLAGATTPDASNLPDDAILVARNLGPAEFLEYDHTKIKGILLEEGGPTSHATILARAAGIPLIGRLGTLLSRIETGDPVILDARSGEVYLRPEPKVSALFAEVMVTRSAEQAVLSGLRDTPAITIDGHRIGLLLNAGLPMDIPAIKDTGADGVGLYRTEFGFMVSERLPRLDEETSTYRQVLDLADGKPVTFRTLDVGADKVVPYLGHSREDNPALGWRAIRMGLDKPSLIRRQYRALIAAAQGRELDIMVPMAATACEVARARELLDQELVWAQNRGRALPKVLRFGAMLETPALAFDLPHLKGLVDFISLGTNDLSQYFFAADRGNPRVADRYDLLSSAGIRLLMMIADEAQAQAIETRVCGEAAGKPLDAMVLLSLGYHKLSVAAGVLARIKRLALSLHCAKMKKVVVDLAETRTSSVRAALTAAAKEQNVAI